MTPHAPETERKVANSRPLELPEEILYLLHRNDVGEPVREKLEQAIKTAIHIAQEQAVGEERERILKLIDERTEYPSRTWSKSLEDVELSIAVDGLETYKRELKDRILTPPERTA